MKKLIFFACFLASLLPKINAQVTCDPVFPSVTDNVTIYYDASQGNAALAGFAGPVFAHMGVITDQSSSPSDWKHVVTTWGVNDPVGAMTSAGTNLWKKTFTINTFFNIQPGETVLKLAFVFRSQDGSVVGRAADGSDIFYDLVQPGSPLQTLYTTPQSSAFLTGSGTQIPVTGVSSQTANLSLFEDGSAKASASGKSLNHTLTAGAAGVHRVDFVATTATEQDTSTFLYVVPGTIVTADPPAGTESGINYIDNNTVRLSLYAPNKQVVHVMGDFNNWLPGASDQMKRGSDGATWWIDVPGLTPGQIYRFQYLVDGALRIADPLSTLVLNAGNDPFIPASTYPNLPAYPTGKTSGTVSVFQTDQQPFNWQASNYQRPKKTDLVVYELLMRDFLAAHDYPTLLDTLDYIERLGVTAIELMPVNEFDGNNSWGYNPSFHKALDKYYGTADALKMVIDECHQRGIAVILDVVFNQASGNSPLAQLYWNAAANTPAADNPWLNPQATHPYSVFNDFNHESQATKAYVKNCLKYWLAEFRVDGFRFDLSKGFTQTVTGGNVGAWGQYDASRVAILKDYADFIWSLDPENYVILEHFADNTEEKELAEYGMMLWGNMFGSYKEAALGYNLTGSQTDMSWVSYQQRNWNVPHLIGYMESHDEERIGYECATFGNAAGDYNVKWLPVYGKRIELMNNLLFTVPGPKMLWEFGELAYDFPINLCENGSINSGCRTSPKPVRWDFVNDPYRRRVLDVTTALLQLRKSYDVFETTDYQINIGPGTGRTVRLNSPSMNVHVMANVALVTGSVTPNFQHTGTWYEYYTGTTLDVTNVNAPLDLGPGEYRLYTDQFVALPPNVNPTPVREIAGILSGLELYPNPAGNYFALDFSLDESARVVVETCDPTGRLIYRNETGELPSGPQHIEIPSGSWQQGVYFIRVSDDRGGQLTKRLVKY
ncbi:MAG: T9SS type A sorting domain-containing protein [Saprospiraceae bacterium]|nr:T9SS type A sorting domain-containing protein [Saprospiraceae bacterium]